MCHMKKLTHVFEHHGNKDRTEKSQQIQVDGIFCIIYMTIKRNLVTGPYIIRKQKPK